MKIGHCQFETKTGDFDGNLRRFLSQGISSMLLFGDARNPSNLFYEALGAERLFAANGEFHGAYGWRDLRRLGSICPTD
jgi:hypothetical protein